MVDPAMGLEALAFVFMVVIIGGLGSIKGTLISAIIVGQVVSLGSLVHAPLALMAPFAIMLLILLIKPTGLCGSALLKRYAALCAESCRARDRSREGSGFLRQVKRIAWDPT